MEVVRPKKCWIGWETGKDYYKGMATRLFPADKAFSFLVRTRDKWACKAPRCTNRYEPPTMALHCSHFYGRGKWNTRFDPANAWSFCYGHHRYYDKHIGEYEALKIEELGQRQFDGLTARAWARSPLGSNFWKKLSYKKAMEILEPLFDGLA